MEKSAPVVFDHDCDRCIPLSRPNWYWCPSSVVFSHGTLLRRDSDKPSDYLSYSLGVIANAIEKEYPLSEGMREMFEEVLAVEKAAAADMREELFKMADSGVEISPQPDPASEPAAEGVPSDWKRAALLLASKFSESAPDDEIVELFNELADYEYEVRSGLLDALDREVSVPVAAGGGGEIIVSFSVEGEWFEESVEFELAVTEQVSVPLSELSEELSESSAVVDFFAERASKITASVGRQVAPHDVTFEFETFERGE